MEATFTSASQYNSACSPHLDPAQYQTRSNIHAIKMQEGIGRGKYMEDDLKASNYLNDIKGTLTSNILAANGVYGIRLAATGKVQL